MHIRKEVISERARRCGIVGEGTTNSPRDAERRYLWVVKLEVMATTLQHVGLSLPNWHLQTKFLNSMCWELVENVTHILCDMVKFWKTTDKPRSCTKHLLKQCKAHQGETSIDDTAVVDSVRDKRISKAALTLNRASLRTRLVYQVIGINTQCYFTGNNFFSMILDINVILEMVQYYVW